MAAGSIAKVSGSTQGIPGLTAAVLDVGTIDTDPDNVLTEVSAGRFQPDEEGYYLILASGRFQITHNNRINIGWQVTWNSTALAGTGGSSYARNNGNPYAYPRCGAVLHFNGTSDYFEVTHIRDTGAGAPAGSYDWTRLKVVQLSAGGTSSMPYGRYGTPTAGAFTGTTPTAIAGWDAITETDTATIELQGGGTAIRLKEANRAYLVIYGLENSDAGDQRTQRVADVTLGGTRVGASVGYAYQRDSANQRAIPFGMALVRPTSANLDLNVRCWSHDLTIQGTFWGVFDDSTWTLSAAAAQAGVMVVALPTSAAVAIFDDATANQAVAGAADVTLTAFTTQVTADSPFTRDSATAVTVSEATEVLAYSAYMLERTSSSGVRNTSATRWVLEAVELTADTEYGNYLRGDQSNADCPNMTFGSIFVNTVAANDTFQLEKFDPGTDDGANDFTSMGGAFFIDLASLAAGPTAHVITVADTFGVVDTQAFVHGRITSVDSDYGAGSNEFRFSDTSVDVNGANFEAAQGTGAVYLSDVSTLAGGANEVAITAAVSAWADGQVTLNFSLLAAGVITSLHGLGSGARYLILVNNSGNEFQIPVALHRPIAFTLSLSPNIAPAAATATTPQLTPPPTKTTGDHTPGKISDDTNPATVDIGNAGYVELEFAIEATAASLNGGAYNFRVVADDVPLDTYTQIPTWTIGAAGPTAHDITVTDLFGITDSQSIDQIQAHNIAIADVFGLTDAVDPTAAYQVAVVDLFGLVDTQPIVHGIAHTITVTDLLGLVDTVDATHGQSTTDWSIVVTDTFGYSDIASITHNQFTTDWTIVVADGFDITDTVDVVHTVAPTNHDITVTDLFGLVDTQAIDHVEAHFVVVADLFGLVDALVVVHGINHVITVTDLFGLVDVADVVWTNTPFNHVATVTDLFGLVDTSTATHGVNRQVVVADLFGLTDSAAATHNQSTTDHTITVADVFGYADIASVTHGQSTTDWSIVVADGFNIVDSQTFDHVEVHQITVADLFGAVDALVVVHGINYVVTVVNAFGLVDNTDATHTQSTTDWAVTVTDLFGAVDTVDATHGQSTTDWSIVVTDTFGITEANQFSYGDHVFDLFGLTDTVDVTHTPAPTDNHQITVVDSFGYADIASIVHNQFTTDWTIAVADGFGLVDSQTFDHVEAHVIIVTDLFGLVDSQAIVHGINHTVTVTDVFGVIDTVSMAVTNTLAIADSFGLVDSLDLVHGVNHQITVADLFGIVDSQILDQVEAHFVVVSDLFGLVDTQFFGHAEVHFVVITDPMGIVDFPAITHNQSTADHNIVVTDTFGYSDIVDVIHAQWTTDWTIVVADGFGLVDTTDMTHNSAAVGWTIEVTDIFGVLDAADVVWTNTPFAHQVTVVETFGLGDAMAIAQGHSIAIVDAFGFVDSTDITHFIAPTGWTITVTDVFGLTDTADVVWTNTPFGHTIVVSDLFGTVDLVDLATQLFREITDTMSLSDTVSVVHIPAGGLVEGRINWGVLVQ